MSNIARSHENPPWRCDSCRHKTRGATGLRSFSSNTALRHRRMRNCGDGPAEWHCQLPGEFAAVGNSATRFFEQALTAARLSRVPDTFFNRLLGHEKN